MRRIREAVLPMASSDEHLPKTVREFRAKYKGVSRILDEHPEILVAAHEDFKKLSQGGRKGRSGDFTSETLLRALVVYAIEGLSLRETVPAAERVFSIFEPHTELIKRGRREKPVEFGHAFLLCQTPEKFITDYEVFKQRPADCTLTAQVIERHEKLFGERPEVLAKQGMT